MTVAEKSEGTTLQTFPEAWLAMPGPVEIDLGCHKGFFLAGMAERFPTVRFLGIERQRGRVERALARVARLELANAHVIQGDGLAQIVDAGLPVSVIHVLFPDPWPKRRHHSRRLVQAAFLRDAWRVLLPNGRLRLMTDDAPYFRAMQRNVAEFDGFVEDAWEDGREYPLTEFQRKFVAIGKPIHQLALRRCDSSSSS